MLKTKCQVHFGSYEMLRASYNQCAHLGVFPIYLAYVASNGFMYMYYGAGIESPAPKQTLFRELGLSFKFSA